ncbi:hypothetical protein BCR15_08360 [Tessaracoccus lapidicaptus]|uniref:Uncharacterized protein n=1 Tax=Tessaracoccus lapidicaptus TaxID=1427523 RepID=A0A1C0AJ12_9ACTN|nr:hypothetical protein BKM78_07455 [Tessaracoccus sp. T2.5-30]OCL32045.1 hypothetical protein BCR15_08360 [Tessaracoccus lapidicaptus]
MAARSWHRRSGHADDDGDCDGEGDGLGGEDGAEVQPIRTHDARIDVASPTTAFMRSRYRPLPHHGGK